MESVTVAHVLSTAVHGHQSVGPYGARALHQLDSNFRIKVGLHQHRIEYSNPCGSYNTEHTLK